MRFRWYLFILALVSAWCLPVRAQEEVTVTPPVMTNSAIKNPGKGWVLYTRNLPLDSYAPNVLALASVAVWRWEWAELEPAENVFNWNLIDEALMQCSRYGLKCNFSVQCANSGSERTYVTPKWVFDAGAKGVSVPLPKRPNNLPIATNQVVPVFDDSVYMAKVRDFLKAMAARYDGNPHIAFIDIRSYGNWGENHVMPWSSLVGMKDISPERFRAHIQAHLDVFRKTPLCLPWGANDFRDSYEWAVGKGVWLRHDGVGGGSDGSELKVFSGRVPAVFEGYAEYSQMKQYGWWDGKQTSPGVGFAFEQCIDNGCPTYAPLGQAPWDTARLMQDEPKLVVRLSNRIGYNFVLRRAAVPTVLRPNEPVRLQFRWENIGVSRMHGSCALSVALLDDSGRVTTAVWPTGCDPSKWTPGLQVNEEVHPVFGLVKPGKYRLAIGLFEHLGDAFPAIRLGNDTEVVNGWHVLARVFVEKPERVR